MKRGELVRVHRSARALYGPGQVVEFVAGTLAVVVSRFPGPGRTYYNVLYNGQVVSVEGRFIEPLVPCNRRPAVV